MSSCAAPSKGQKEQPYKDGIEPKSPYLQTPQPDEQSHWGSVVHDLQV